MGIFATGIEAPEGPICLDDGSMYVTEMSHATLSVAMIDTTGNKQVLHKTNGRPNGLALDGKGRIWIAEAGLSALICIDASGNELRRTSGDGDVKTNFLFPNDLCFSDSGLLYMTDSGMRIADFLDGQNFAEGYKSFDWDGRVYEIDPVSMKVQRVIDDQMLFTNGICFGPDGMLYANASFTGEIYRYDLSQPRPKRELFGNVLQPVEGDDFAGPDGMKFGTDGRLYCTVYGQQNVTVLNADGSVAERLPLTGPNPTNCAFALSGRKLRVTEVGIGQVEEIDVPCDGLPLTMPVFD
jgi:gluconolactonase